MVIQINTQANVFESQPKGVRDRDKPGILDWGPACPISRQVGDQGDMITQKIDHWTGERHVELPLAVLIPLKWRRHFTYNLWGHVRWEGDGLAQCLTLHESAYKKRDWLTLENMETVSR